MRIPIRVQLALLVIITSLVALTVVSVATWVNNYNFVVDIKSQGLALAASLKAAQVAGNLKLLQSTSSSIASRLLIQQSLRNFYAGNSSDSNWARAIADVQSALSIGDFGSLMQLIIYPKNNTGNTRGLVNVTSGVLSLPYTYPNGSAVMLGDPGPGYPPMLYPNLTYTSTPDPGDSKTNTTTVHAFSDFELNSSARLLLGPMTVNRTFSIYSLTLPIISNINADVLGFMTVVSDCSNLCASLKSREGVDNTGIVLLVGPARPSNIFAPDERPSNSTYLADDSSFSSALVHYVFPPTPLENQADRHSIYRSQPAASFPLSSYPAIFNLFADNNSAINNASSQLTTTNEQGVAVAVGLARPRNQVVDWALVVEQTHDEAWSPVLRLQRILLACVFGTIGLIILLVVPVAHFGVLPIKRLKEATERTVQPRSYTPAGSKRSDRDNDAANYSGDEESHGGSTQHKKKQPRIIVQMRNLGRPKQRSRAEQIEDARRKVFKVPGKVQDRKHFITDELTELTGTFNEMSDELIMQYEKLEERVAERTRELEISKKAAEAANESKTLFIANISHELKTPLNGILGMCAVCMDEDDLPKIKKSLEVVYKSGDLLLHLLDDLLTFSKNQIGHSLALNEMEFSLSDIKSQIITIFDKQVREGRINFDVYFVCSEDSEFGSKNSLGKYLHKSLPTFGPAGTGRLEDMKIWGDQHRILQVIINLVSNGLKFTPEGGRVEVRIRCLGEVHKLSHGSQSKRDPLGSKKGSQRRSRNHNRIPVQAKAPSSSPSVPMATGTTLLLNQTESKTSETHIQVRERSPTLPPTDAKTLMFEFEVEDTGPGIPPALQQRVFEPFVQGDPGLSKKYGGTGLGLSICSQLARLMSGSITLDSTVGVGTKFKMRLPLKYVGELESSSSVAGTSAFSEAEGRGFAEKIDHTERGLIDLEKHSHSFGQDPHHEFLGLHLPIFASLPIRGSSEKCQPDALDHITASSNLSRKIRVLVAEDNIVNQEVVLRMLKLEDICDVTVAKDGQEAYDIVKANMEEGTVFNLIFMDVQMPNLDGLQSTRLIRRMGCRAPIVALTAFAEEGNVKDCLDSGMDMFLSKPIRRLALQKVLKRFASTSEDSETATSFIQNTENIAENAMSSGTRNETITN